MMHSAAMRSEEVAREAPGSLPSSAPPSMHQCSAAVSDRRGNDLPRSGRKERKRERERSSKSNFPSYVLHLLSPFAFVPLSRFYPSGESAPFHLWNGLVSSGLGRKANFTNNLQAFCRGPSVPLHICAAHITHHLTCFRINSSFLPLSF